MDVEEEDEKGAQKSHLWFPRYAVFAASEYGD